jgi:hypothetical protein
MLDGYFRFSDQVFEATDVSRLVEGLRWVPFFLADGGWEFGSPVLSFCHPHGKRADLVRGILRTRSEAEQEAMGLNELLHVGEHVVTTLRLKWRLMPTVIETLEFVVLRSPAEFFSDELIDRCAAIRRRKACPV